MSSSTSTSRIPSSTTSPENKIYNNLVIFLCYYVLVLNKYHVAVLNSENYDDCVARAA